MRTGKVSYLSDLHFDHTQWKSELAFWDYELKFMERQLASIVEKNWKHRIPAQVEHFQNVFPLHREKMKMLDHKISRHEELLARVVKLLPSEVEQQHFHDHAAVREGMANQRQLFRQLKDEFFLFLEAEVNAGITMN